MFVCCGFGFIMVHPSDVIQQHHLCNDKNINHSNFSSHSIITWEYEMGNEST